MKTSLLFWAGMSALGLPLLTGCHKPSAPPAPATLPTVAVQVQTVASQPYTATEEVVGTVRARVRATLEAKVSGRIEAMPVAVGQAVKKDEVLVRLEVREIQARLDQARALRLQAEQDRKRFAALLDQKAVTQQEYDAVEARFRVADAGVTEAETMLGYAQVTAPFDGVVSRKLADVGDLAAPGRPLLEIEDPASLRLEADVPEALSRHVHLGDSMSVRLAALTRTLVGTVSEIAPVADPNSRTYRVKFDLPATAGIRLGEFGRVAVPVGQTTALRVPASAVVVRGQMELVFVVTNQVAQLRLVKTGKRFETEVELVSGVSAGEPVVVAGAASLLDGQPVQVP
ncbi:MAG: efflux RND transporter periplasmic adaptor subunit [Verrucomicrobia bacterium]|nr:efflux RND transporter periplasmic adaptor subunit [Verrucomicrobiota bacterium]